MNCYPFVLQICHLWGSSVSVRKRNWLLCMHMVSCQGLLVPVAHFWSGTGAFKWYQQCQMKGAQGQIPRPSVPCLTHLFVSKLTNWTGQTPGTGWQWNNVDKKNTAFIYLLASFYLAVYAHLPKVSTHWCWCDEKSFKTLNFVALQKQGKESVASVQVGGSNNEQRNLLQMTYKKLAFTCSSIFSGLTEHACCRMR